MSDLSARLAGMYETSIRAADTKSQIFLVFMGISLGPALGLLTQEGAPRALVLAATGLFLVSAALLAACVWPRSAGAPPGAPFFRADAGAEELREALSAPESPLDMASVVTALHLIYRRKLRWLRAGMAAMALYLGALAALLAAAALRAAAG